MSQGTICHEHDRSNFRITHLKHNHSAFNGYHQTYSDFSTVVCIAPRPGGICGHVWRSKASWLAEVPLLEKGEHPQIPERSGRDCIR